MSQVVANLNKDTPKALSMQIMNGKNSNGSFLNYSLVIDNTEPHEVMEVSGPNRVELGNITVLSSSWYMAHCCGKDLTECEQYGPMVFSDE